jgi:hypothetical protein
LRPILLAFLALGLCATETLMPNTNTTLLGQNTALKGRWYGRRGTVSAR